MSNNLFEELQQKKQQLLTLTSKAKEFGWIDSTREKDIIDKINNDVLTIGVIGQMKCGKSTFLNAFVFEDDILPSATTPMTASLSVITYGPEKKIVADFYTKDEWEEQKMQASRSLDDVKENVLELSKVKAAKELVEKANKLGASLEEFLGKAKTDSFDNLIEYVGADGKYISITKSVTIYYPKEYLKGVEIVDTPGFNDPIVSREERTKSFLKNADVVLLMLYAGRPFDATDRDILFKNVGQCGTGRVLIGINKYDIPYGNGDTESEIKDYVKEQLNRASKECGDNLMVELLKNTEPIPLSAEMALLSELPMSRITGDDVYHHAWERACDYFEISGQQQMREKSHIDQLILAVKKVIETEKEDILFRKPMNAIMAEGNKRINEVDKNLQEYKITLDMLNQPDEELEERQEKYLKAERRLNKKIDNLGDDIESSLKDLVRRGRNKLEDDIEVSCKKMDNIIDDLGRFSSPDSIFPRLEREIQTLITRTLKREVEDIGRQAKGQIRNAVSDFFTDVEDVLMRYLEDFDSHDFIKGVDKEINLDIENEEPFTYDNSNNDKGDYGVGDLVFDFFDGASWGLLSGATNYLAHGDYTKQMHENVNKLRNSDVSDCLDSIFGRKDDVINKVRTRFIDELITPLQHHLDEIRKNTENKELQRKEINNKLVEFQSQKTKLVQQIAEVKNTIS